MKILIAADSSGGHIFPAIATAAGLRELDKESRILFVSGKKAIAENIFKNEGYEYRSLSADRKIFKDLFSSFSILREFKPNITVGFGGYASFPVLVAARMLNIPTMAHEQNVFPGLANRVLSNLVGRVALSFEETNRFFLKKSVLKETGNPLRPNLAKINRDRALEGFGLDKEKFTILVMGGSQGAHFINETALAALSSMDKAVFSRLQVIHLSGAGDYELVKSGYGPIGVENRVFPFLDMMSQAYSACDLVISRSGATTIAELAFFARPAILVPYPNPKVHQFENARFFAQNGAAVIIEQRQLSGDRLKRAVIDLMGDAHKLKSMSENSARLLKPDAAHKLAAEILNAAKR